MPEVGFDPYPEDIAVPRLYPPALGVGPPTGHVDSPLFTMLPAEVRLHIYAAAFEDSYIYEYSALRPSHHRRLLFACRRLYEEAMPVYWSHTLVDMGGQNVDRGPGVKLHTIPSHARLYIRHISNVARMDPWDIVGWWFTKMLRHLPRLRTCILCDAFSCQYVQTSIADFDHEFQQRRESGHWLPFDKALDCVKVNTRFWRRNDTLGYPGVVLQRFVNRFYGFGAYNYGGWRQEGPYIETYLNHTTNHEYSRLYRPDDTDRYQLSKEEGFRRVMDPTAPKTVIDMFLDKSDSELPSIADSVSSSP